ncbi:helix-turn-helix transcriptional regulator [Bacillus sp. Bva_UNVM-123]|uniref:helix-turn-helix domain-containing protein n=1 Tax=Bacillus sp. Bva_UNVM-123 TaxID=2829798 RepID=UPI00391EF824
MKILAERLKWLREKNRFGQKEVAANIGITLSGYQKIEYNETNPKIDTLIELARFFKVSSDFLLGISDYTEDLQYLSEELYELRKIRDIRTHDFLSVMFNDKIDEEFKSDLSENIRGVEIDFNQKYLKFLLEFSEVPISNFHNNYWIYAFSPFKIQKQEVFGGESIEVAIRGREGLECVIGFYDNVEEANEKIRYFEDLLKQ